MNTKNIIEIMITICCLVYTGYIIKDIFKKIGTRKGFAALGKILFYSTLLTAALYVSSEVSNLCIMKGTFLW